MFYGDDDFNKNLAYDSDEKTLSFFDGILLNRDFYTDDISLLDKQNFTDHFKIIGNYCAGVFSCFGTNFIHQSVLGTYNLFWAKSKEIVVVSNNPHLIALAIKKGKVPRTNYMALMGMMAYGMGGDLETIYKGIYYFPNNAGIVIQENSEAVFYPLTEKLYQKKLDVEFEQNFNEAYESLLSSVKAIKKTKISRFVGNITGGMDSRTALALLIKCGLEKNFSFDVHGVLNHPDVLVAQQIAKAFELNLNTNDIKEWNFESKDYEESLAKNMFSFWGERNIAESGNKRKNLNAFGVICAGLAGELIRETVYKKSFKEDDANTLQNIQKIRCSFNGLKKIEDNLFKRIVQCLQRFPTAKEFVLWRRWMRCSHFHGGPFHRRIYSPLFNTQMHNLAFSTNPEMRNASHLNFKIIERACPNLLKVPFADKKWDEFNFKDRSDADEFRKIEPVKSDNVFRPAVYLSSKKVDALKKYIFHPDKKIFKFLDKKKYWSFIRQNYGKKDPKTDLKMCIYATPSFWIKNLKKGKIFPSGLSLSLIKLMGRKY